MSENSKVVFLCPGCSTSVDLAIWQRFVKHKDVRCSECGCHRLSKFKRIEIPIAPEEVSVLISAADKLVKCFSDDPGGYTIPAYVVEEVEEAIKVCRNKYE